MYKLLIIDDEQDICRLLSDFLQNSGFKVFTAYSGTQGLQIIEKENVDLALCDFRLDDMDGLELLLRIKDVWPDLPVVIITGYSDLRMAIRVIKHGAYDYITKPLYTDEILLCIQQALAESKQKTENKLFLNGSLHMAESQPMKEIYRQADLVAATELSVIIQGESGTGKECFAKEIHQKSNRRNQAFITLDCSTLHKEFAVSELFGHEKGAFPGAASAKTGSFEMANGGSLFLDEITDLPYDAQVSLLKALQERKIRHIGGSRDIPVDVRIIVASNQNLYGAVQAGRFREDLYHRLNEFCIPIPPLRERPEDIVPLAEHFLKRTNLELDKSIRGFSDETLQVLKQYSWPGNIRELRNVIRRAVLVNTSEILEPGSLPQELVFSSKNMPLIQTNLADKQPLSLKTVAHRAEMEKIMDVLRQVNFNRTKAARMLNIDRKTLYNKLKEFGL